MGGNLMLKDKWLKLDIQHFAEEVQEAEEGGQEATVPTEEEIQKRIESESDRKLASALEKKQKEWESLTEQKIQEAIAEKERLSKLSEKDRKDEELSKREKELAD